MSSTELITNLEYALMLGRMGFKVLPCCWAGLTGKCACPKKHGTTPQTVNNIGKAPLTNHAVKDATADQAVINNWWSRWPLANVAIDLAGYIMVDPDSDDAQIEAEELGLPPTLKRLSRNDAYIYNAPEDLPIARLIHRGSTRAIDLLSGGYCLVYGRHRTGCEISLQDVDMEPADAPKWVLDLIWEWALEKADAEVPTTQVGPNVVPPVVLNKTGMEWWDGTRSISEDRSSTLYQIGHVLAKANASPTVIADALSERDASLGYRKFSKRTDRARQYSTIAQKVFDAQGRRDEFSLRNQTPSIGEVNSNNHKQDRPQRNLLLVTLDTVAPEKVRWLWPQRIPHGKLTIIGGNPGVGKSFLTLDIASRVSVGGVWPDGGRVTQGYVLLASVEDGLADTIRPRLGALGAELGRISYIQPLLKATDTEEDAKPPKSEVFNLDDHIGQLQDAILAKHASLLIIDPVMAFMGGKTDTYKDSEVRRVLMPLSAMAEFTGCAIVAVTHPNKKTTESKSLFRMGGSLAFMAIARSGFVVGQDPDKEDRKIFAPTKHNLTTPAHSLAFGITSDGYLAWEDGECDITADAAMGDSADRSQVDLAKTFLFNSLSSADVLHSDIKILAESEGIANRTLYRAKALLKIVSTQLDHKGKRGGGASMWHLPKTLDE